MSLHVSIITPVYNQKDYIEETIQSVLDQDYDDLEYIVVDDGSTDGTSDVLKKYEEKVHLLHHENMGQYATVNKAFPVSSGEIVGIVNSDDPLLEGAVAEIVKVFEANPDVIVVYPDWEMIDEDGKLIRRIRTRDYDYADMVRSQECVPGPATFFRRWVFERLGGRNPEFRFIADLDFWLRAGALGRFQRLPRTLATFRMHSRSISSSQRDTEWAQEHLRIVDKFFSQEEIPAVALKYRSEAYASAYYLAGTITFKSDVKAGLRYIKESFKYIGLRYLSEWYYIRRLLVIVGTLTYYTCTSCLKRRPSGSKA